MNASPKPLVHATLEQSGSYAQFKPAGFLSGVSYDAFIAATEGARYDRQARKRLAPLDKVPAILVRLRAAGFDVKDGPGFRVALQGRNAQEVHDLKAAQERIVAIDEELFKQTGNRLFPFQKTGAQWLTLKYGALLADDMGLGKDQPKSEPVLTPDGWRPIGELKVGDEVIGSGGVPTCVEAIYPQGEKEIYEVRLKDGRGTRCGLEHLWFVKVIHADYPPFPSFKLLTLSELMRGMETWPEDSWALPFLPTVEAGTGGWSEIAHIRSKGVKEDSVCIRVAARDHLYVTNDYILTHNTIQTIVALPANASVLVIAPAVAKGVWRGEVRKWRPQIRTGILNGRDSFRWPKPGEMIITNYDILPDIHDREGVSGRKCEGFYPPKKCPGCAEHLVFTPDGANLVKNGQHLDDCTGFLEPFPCPGCHPFLKDAPPGMVLVVDEAHNVKSSKAARTHKVRAISVAVRSKEGRVWLLTGTPLENAPKELWDVFKAANLELEAFGSWDAFVTLFKGKKLKFGGYEWGLPDEEIRERLQRVSLRRMKVEVLPELPSKVYGEYEVELDAKAIRACEMFLASSGRTVDQIVNLLQKEEIGIDEMSPIRASLAAAKIPAMLAFVKDVMARDEPLIVFSAHRAPIDTLAKLKGWAVITGDVTSEKKKEIEEKFQRGELKGVGLTIRAGGVAITLTRAWQALFVDRDWKPTANLQAEDRLLRIGQTKCVRITTLVADHPLDQRVTEVLLRKMRLITASVDAAAVADDAPEAGFDGRFEEQLRKVREDIACGKAVRRVAESGDETLTLEVLHTGRFRTASDERIAGQLAEEARTIGLSDPQWELATRVAARAVELRGREPVTAEERKRSVEKSERRAETRRAWGQRRSGA